MVHLYHDYILQGKRFKVVYRGVLVLGLIMMHVYYDFALPSRRFRVV
jgi:hypothetical protein